jgi:hypothetical protein
MDLDKHQTSGPLCRAVTPWALRAWPPVLWQALEPSPVRFHHVGTHIAVTGDLYEPPAGQTIWAADSGQAEAGMAWDWIEIASGVVAIADPMSVITNVRFVGGAGQVLTAHEAALFLNELVRTLPWQHEVQRALGHCND